MKRVELYFDYASPFAYLASELVGDRLAGADLVYRPIYLRGLDTFAKGLPYLPHKLTYLFRDFARCAAHEGVKVAPPATMPINGLYAIRGALYTLESGGFPAYHRAMFAAAWRESRDISRKEETIAVAAAAGLDAAAFAAGIESPAIKERCREDTAEAQARGVFGVPSFFVGDELFWGHDRLDYVARALS